MRKLYVKRERALACFGIPYHCVVGEPKEEHLRWAAEQDRETLLHMHGPNSLRSGEMACAALDDGPNTMFVIAYQEHGELTTEEISIPGGTEDLYYVIRTVFDGDRRLSLELAPAGPEEFGFREREEGAAAPPAREERPVRREPVDLTACAGHIAGMVKRGVLLNTKGDKFNAMVIGWGHLGTIWGMDTFVVYVRESRYTKAQLDKTGEFTVSIPLDAPDPEITRICGSLSGRDADKAAAAGLTLTEPEVIRTPGVREYPLTLECEVLYAQKQDLSLLPEDIRERMYPRDVPGTAPMANRDAHTAYIGKIVSAYIIR